MPITAEGVNWGNGNPFLVFLTLRPVTGVSMQTISVRYPEAAARLTGLPISPRSRQT